MAEPVVYSYYGAQDYKTAHPDAIMEIQDPKTGLWFPYVPGDAHDNGRGNIRITQPDPTTPAAQPPPAVTPPTGGPPPPSGDEPPPPTGNPPPTTGGQGGNGLINPFPGGGFTPPPQLNYQELGFEEAPRFQAPTFSQAPAFAAPTWETARDDPGYQFVQKMGQQGLERSAAARGVLNTGGTLQDISQWNQGLADTQYQNVFNRQANEYNTNYKTQYLDPYEKQYTAAMDQFSPTMDAWKTKASATQRANEMNYLNAFDLYKNQYQQWLDRIHESENLNNY